MSFTRPLVRRWKRFLTVFVIVILCLPMSWIAREVYTTNQYYKQVVQLRSSIDAMEASCPDDVPAAQWKEAVQWTSNLVVQDFFGPHQDEYPGLVKLNQQLELKKNDPIDLAKLRWIWDEIEVACGGPNSVASRFRDVKLMTKGSITDERLPSLWALERSTGLDLSETEITDASVPFLQSLPKLERLDVNKTKITAIGAKKIQDSRVGLQVFHESIP